MPLVLTLGHIHPHSVPLHHLHLFVPSHGILHHGCLNRRIIGALRPQLSAEEEHHKRDGPEGSRDETEGRHGPGASEGFDHLNNDEGNETSEDEAEGGSRCEGGEGASGWIGVKEVGYDCGLVDISRLWSGLEYVCLPRLVGNPR